MLNMSAIISKLNRSPKYSRLAILRSLKTVQGVVPALRPRFPSRDSIVPSKPAMQGSWNTPVGENFECTTCPQAGFTVTFGRPVTEESCRLSPFPVMMLNGRPDPNSTSGATVQLLNNLLAKPLPERRPV